MGSRASWRQSWCMLLDVDSALLERGNLASEATADADLVYVLPPVADSAGGALCLSSARPILRLDELFAPLRLAAIGVGGPERRTADGRFVERPVDWPPLVTGRGDFREWPDEHLALSVEDRAVALMLRWDDEVALGVAARSRVVELFERMDSDFEMHEGSMCVDLRPIVCNHALAVEPLFAKPSTAGCVPQCVGDESLDAETSRPIERPGGWMIAVGRRSTLPLSRQADWPGRAGGVRSRGRDRDPGASGTALAALPATSAARRRTQHLVHGARFSERATPRGVASSLSQSFRGDHR